MPFLSHEGVSLRYDRTGGGPAVLLIHGWTCNRTFWERQAQALRDRHTVITVDLRGHGESSRPRTGYSIGAMAGDLEHLVRALKVPRIAIVGWSMGGIIAQELARRLGERASALVLVCSTPGGLEDEKEAPEYRAGIAGDCRAFLRAFAARFTKEGDQSPLLPWIASQIQKTAPHVVSLCFESMLKTDLRPNMKSLAVPTTVIHGRHDTLLPLKPHGEALAKGIAKAKLVVFDESAHAPFLEEPERFNQEVATALESQ